MKSEADTGVDVAVNNSSTHSMKSQEDGEIQMLEEQIAIPPTKVTYGTLFRYADSLDKITLILCAILALAGGAALPLMTVLLGGFTGSFRDYFAGLKSEDSIRNDINKYSLDFLYLAIGEFLTIFASMAGFSLIGQRLVMRIRDHYLRAVLYQNIGFFDRTGAGEISTRISSDMALIQEGISEKISLALVGFAAFVASIVIAFVKSWKLSLIVLSTLIAMVLSMGIGSKMAVKFKTKALVSQADGGNVVEETVSSIRTITSYGAQQHFAKKYRDTLKEKEIWGIRMRTASGILMGLVMMIIYSEHALAFWQGSRFLVSGDVSVSAVLTIQLAIMLGGAYLGQSLPHIQAFPSAVAAATKIFSVIDRKPPIDAQSGSGDIIQNFEGRIDFDDVKFIYPSRPAVVVMPNFNLSIPSGKITALVGASGCGKSTTASLIQRFYSPVRGKILFDGRDISSLRLRWLRQQMSLVSQEPVLFSTSIYENIACGLIGTRFEKESKQVKMLVVIDAAKTANAHDFIMSMPECYETQVGHRGRLLSGGQKQRVVIARAIVSDPKILLLDEATSALDSKSEKEVQKAMDQAAQGRTTLIIAHRLSTIREAHSIAVISAGQVVEQGSHDELVNRKGAYYNLYCSQNLYATKNHTDKEERISSEAQIGGAYGEEKEVLFSKHDHAEIEEKVSIVEAEGLKNIPPSKNRKISMRKLIMFMWSLSKQEKWFTLLGMISAVLSGANQPVRGILFGYSIRAISLPPSQSNKIRHEANFWSIMFFVLALVELIAYPAQGLAFAVSSEKLIKRAQDLAFQSILDQDIAYFDKNTNSPGAVSARLSVEANLLAGISAATLGAVVVFLTTVFGSIGIALGYGWKLSLVCISVIPITIVCGFVRVIVLTRYAEEKKKTGEASSFASEAAGAVTTVASLTSEEAMLEDYHDLLAVEAKRGMRFILKSSTMYAFSQSFMFLTVALGFWYGGGLMVDRKYGILNFFICFTETLFGAQAAGTILTFAPEIGSGKSAAQAFKDMMESKPTIVSPANKEKEGSSGSGLVEFRNVYFRYPERPTVPVLRGLSFEAKTGQFIALVGPSGSGKSTAIALIERFYDSDGGSILVDDRKIFAVNLEEHRRNMALVSQETHMYSGTVRDNIIFDGREVSEEAFINACKSANIHEFIMSLPEGYDTRLGPKGYSLSGGQRQRLSIARALLRNPKILLLDEATSALDSESEQAVEVALQAASKGRTTIAIAHRLSSIFHADVIYVMDQGRVVESGSHTQLMAKQGRYREMVRLQSLEVRTG